MTPREQFDRATGAYEGRPDVESGALMRSHGLKVHGKIFAMLVDDRLVVKLPRGRMAELVESARAEPFRTGPNRVMKEWASIGAAEEATWEMLVDESFVYVTSLIR